MSRYRHPHAIDAWAPVSQMVYEEREVRIRYQAGANWGEPGNSRWGLGALGGNLYAKDDHYVLALAKNATETSENHFYTRYEKLSLDDIRMLGEQLVAFADNYDPKEPMPL